MKSKDRVVIADLAWQIASSRANVHPKHWLRDGDRGGDDENMRHTLAVELWRVGWPDGEVGVLSHICKLLSGGQIAVRAVNDDSAPPNFDEVIKHPKAWYVGTVDADNVLRNFEFWAKLDPQYAQLAAEKAQAGRYTLEEAAKLISGDSERPEKMQEKLLAAAESEVLHMYGPGEMARYQYTTTVHARIFYEEAYWSDLNDWLTANEPRIEFRFDNPSIAPAQASQDVQGKDNVLGVSIKLVQKSNEPDESGLHTLFDGVRYEALNKMFPGAGDWKKCAERASRTGLADTARVGRGLFNPMLAAIWWLDRQNPPQWDMARVYRTLANNLPARSSHLKHLLTGDYD